MLYITVSTHFQTNQASQHATQLKLKVKLMCYRCSSKRYDSQKQQLWKRRWKQASHAVGLHKDEEGGREERTGYC